MFLVVIVTSHHSNNCELDGSMVSFMMTICKCFGHIL